MIIPSKCWSVAGFADAYSKAFDDSHVITAGIEDGEIPRENYGCEEDSSYGQCQQRVFAMLMGPVMEEFCPDTPGPGTKDTPGPGTKDTPGPGTRDTPDSAPWLWLGLAAVALAVTAVFADR
jgi:hypothetical protein